MNRGATTLAILFSGCLGFFLGRSSVLSATRLSASSASPSSIGQPAAATLTTTPDSSLIAAARSHEGTHGIVSNFGAPATSNWTVDESSSPMDDSRTVTLHLTADGSFSSWANEEHTPSLIIRCKESETDLYIVNGTAANPELGLFDRATVRLRIDDGRPYSERWSESTDDEALFAPRPISLARRLANAERLIYEFTPFNSSPVTVTFTVKGLDQPLQKVASACNWTTG